MRKLRKKMTVFLWFAATAFILFLFLEWGMRFSSSKRLSPRERGIIGVVNGKLLSYSAYSSLIGVHRERGIAPYEAEKIAFNVLVEEALLDEVFERMKLKLTDEEVVEIIRNNPPPELLKDTSLQTDGRFDYAKYHSIIASPANLGWVKSYQALIKTQLPRQLVYQNIVATVRPTTIDLSEAYLHENVSLKLEYVVIEPRGATSSKLEVKPDEVREYYEKHKEEFRVPEKPLIHYVYFQVLPTIDDESYIKEEADEIFDRAKQGVPLDTLAIEYNCKITVAENTGRGLINQTPTGAPVKRADGYHIIQGDKELVLPIRPSDETIAKVEEMATNFVEAARGRTSKAGFDDAVVDYGLKVEKSYGEIGELDLSYIDFKKPNKIIGPIEGNNCFYVLKTMGTEPSRVPDLSEVEPIVHEKYLMERAITFAKELLHVILSESKNLSKEDEFKKAMSQNGLQVKTTGLIKLENSPEGTDFFIQALNIQKDKVGIVVTDKDVYLVHCLDRVEPSQEQINKELPEFAGKWMNEEGKKVYTDWLNNLKTTANIKDYRYEIH
ncbi:MAG: SurA N-terminal domain-containing protein [bacterium]|nr:SurA N-terminal domain-containing protein [bacterium]